MKFKDFPVIWKEWYTFYTSILHVEMTKNGVEKCRMYLEIRGNWGPTHFQFAFLIFCNSAAICRPSHYCFTCLIFLTFFQTCNGQYWTPPCMCLNLSSEFALWNSYWTKWLIDSLSQKSYYVASYIHQPPQRAWWFRIPRVSRHG